MPTLCRTSEGSRCGKCLIDLEEAGVKCNKCKVMTHVRCTDLPNYQLVRYARSNCIYTCIQCIKSEMAEEYEEELGRILELVEKERATVLNVQGDVENDSINDLLTEEISQNGTAAEVNGDAGIQRVNVAGTNDETQPNRNDEVVTDRTNRSNNINKNASICKYYIMKTCQHGRLGKECKFSHPKICFKFAKNGDRQGGCKDRRNCKDFHPKLCWESLDKRECSRHRCRYFHLNNTKATYNDEIPERYPSESYLHKYGRERSYAQTARSSQNEQRQTRTENNYRQFNNQTETNYRQLNDQRTNSNSQHVSNVLESRDFFLMDQRMQRLESMLTSILQSVRPPGQLARLADQ